MVSSRHSPRHSRKSPRAGGRPRRRRGGRLQEWIAGSAALTGLLGMGAVAMHAASDHASTAAYTAVSCAAPPKLAADSTSYTPLGVNATSTGQLATATAQFGHLPVIRVYYTGLPDPNAWTTGAPGINGSAVVLSFRVPPAKILSGSDDAALSHFFDSAPAGYPIYYSYYHEPEPFITGGQFTLAEYKAAWSHIVAIADAAHNPYLRSTLILMGWDLDPQSGINFRDFLPAGNVISTLGWDAYPAGTVHNQNPQLTPPADFMGPEVAASQSVGLPFGFAEFALGRQAGRPGWLAEVASYLRSSGAAFGTLFNSAGFPWMKLNDASSIQAWRDAVSGSGLGMSAPPSGSPPGASAPTASARATHSAPSRPGTPAPTTPTATLTAPVITNAAVSPAAFAPTGANHVRIMFKLSQPADISICILGGEGRVLRELDRPTQPTGWSSSWYFGYSAHEGLLPAGTYPVLIVASNAMGSTTAETELTITAQ